MSQAETTYVVMGGRLRCAVVVAFFVTALEPSVSIHLLNLTDTGDVNESDSEPVQKKHLESSSKVKNLAKEPPWVWTAAESGESCDQKCISLGKQCSEEAMEYVNTREKIINVAIKAGIRCNDSEGYEYGDFPSQVVGGACVASGPGYSDSCATQDLSVIRFCACFDQLATAFGDPHLTNLQGDTFDVVREGITTFLIHPHQVASTQEGVKFRVDASIEHPKGDNQCFGFFIVKLWLKGSLIGDDIELSTSRQDLVGPEVLEFKVGNRTMHNITEIAQFSKGTVGKFDMQFDDDRINMRPHHAHNRFKFAKLTLNVSGAAIEVKWSTGKRKPNSLEISASHLIKIGHEWGGILGADDHTWVSTYNQKCKKDPYENMPQLTNNDDAFPWNASASLE